MQFEGALIKEQGQTFAIVVVKANLATRGNRALQDAATSFRPVFPKVPIVLMWQDSKGVPSFWGRKDIADFMANVDLARIPWQRFTVAA